MAEEDIRRSAPEHDATLAYPMAPFSDRYKTYYLVSGMLFLMAALALFLLTGYLVYAYGGYAKIGIPEPFPSKFEPTPSPQVTAGQGSLSQREIYNFYAGILGYTLAPLVSLASAMICSTLGTRLLRASGAVSTQVIAPQDYAVLGPAISSGNEQAITQFIRLSSLSGMTGTFTKVGLTGLPLATISLTLILGLAGLVNTQFFDLAKLTLGAFLGSYVQRQASAQETTAQKS